MKKYNLKLKYKYNRLISSIPVVEIDKAPSRRHFEKGKTESLIQDKCIGLF
jgi:hypothetical protein